ncbi:MAG: DUF169 domain-containing protein, partial [Desulfovibrionaceae bacterium]
MTNQEMHAALYDNLRLYHFPVAIKFLFKDEDVADFENRTAEYVTPVKPMTFCQWEIAARMKGQIVLGREAELGCANARFSFGWSSMSEAEIKSHEKYARDLAQAERFLKTKARLPEGALKAVIVAPLFAADFIPDTVHFYVDNMQAYHLCVDYMAAMDIHPLRTNITMNSSACGGNVYSYLERTANLLPACSGSYNAGKT